MVDTAVCACARRGACVRSGRHGEVKPENDAALGEEKRVMQRCASGTEGRAPIGE